MFDFAWSEIALIGVVALVAIGPKDMPVAIKAVAGMIKKARRMAAEFQTHVDELVREADLHEVRDQFKQLRNFDFRGEIEKAVDADGSIRSTLAQDPLKPAIAPAAVPLSQMGHETRVMERPEHSVVAPAELPEHGILPAAPAFIPPEAAAAETPATTADPATNQVADPGPPAFIPPEYTSHGPGRT